MEAMGVQVFSLLSCTYVFVSNEIAIEQLEQQLSTEAIKTENWCLSFLQNYAGII